MPTPFDITMKQLVEMQPAAWLEFLGLPPARIEIMDADLSTVSVEADKVLLVHADEPFILHIEFQTGYEKQMGRRTLRYNVLIDYRHNLPVLSIVILLRREADGPALTGRVERKHGQNFRYLEFVYSVVRVWELSAETLLTGPLGTLPLTPLSNVSPAELPEILQRMDARFRAELLPEQARELWAGTYILMGLKYPDPLTRQLLKGVLEMHDSATYQAILDEGAILGEARGKTAEARNLIFKIGGKRFGTPEATVQIALEGIVSLERLEFLALRLLEVENWQELLA